MEIRLLTLCLGLFLLATLPSPCANPVYVRLNTNLGNIDVELLPNDAPNTVANFLTYVDNTVISGTTYTYNNSIIHRSLPGFVIQGGGFYNAISNNSIPDVPSPAAPLMGEHLLSNTLGTIAMALSTGPNSGTNEWFFNLIDNSALLDGTSDGGPFTAFGVVANSSSLDIMEQISTVPIFDFGSPLDQLPLLNYTSGDPVTMQNFVSVISMTRLTQEDFPTWQSGSFTTQQLSVPAVSGATATPQNDGISNLLKYFCDIDPSRPMTANDRAALPVVGKTTIGETQYLTLTYRQYALKTGVTLNVQTSADLKTWTTATNPTIVQTGTDPSTATSDPFMQVQVPATGATQFIRLNVTNP